MTSEILWIHANYFDPSETIPNLKKNTKAREKEN